MKRRPDHEPHANRVAVEERLPRLNHAKADPMLGLLHIYVNRTVVSFVGLKKSRIHSTRRKHDGFPCTVVVRCQSNTGVGVQFLCAIVEESLPKTIIQGALVQRGDKPVDVCLLIHTNRPELNDYCGTR